MLSTARGALLRPEAAPEGAPEGVCRDTPRGEDGDKGAGPARGSPPPRVCSSETDPSRIAGMTGKPGPRAAHELGVAVSGNPESKAAGEQLGRHGPRTDSKQPTESHGPGRRAREKPSEREGDAWEGCAFQNSVKNIQK